MREFTFLLIICMVAGLVTYPLLMISKFLKIDAGIKKPRFDFLSWVLVAASLSLTSISLGMSWYFSSINGSSERETELLEFSYLPVSSVFFLVVVFTPVFEEIAFRGIFQGFLLRLKLAMAVVFVIVSALWAVLHAGYWVSTIIEIFVAGLLLSAIRYRTGSVMPCIFLHIAHNAAAWHFN